jgi:hypothetical protein
MIYFHGCSLTGVFTFHRRQEKALPGWGASLGTLLFSIIAVARSMRGVMKNVRTGFKKMRQDGALDRVLDMVIDG